MSDFAIEKTVPPAQDDENPTSLVTVPQDRYAYYRRCCQLRRNGQQCKGPAMKGETVCYSHFNQAELRRFRERERRNVLGALLRAGGTGNDVGRAMHKIGMALVAGHIDEKSAGRMMREIRIMVSAAKRGDASAPGAAGHRQDDRQGPAAGQTGMQSVECPDPR